ncbi:MULTISPECIES: adenylosuccinate synthetase [Ruminococcus]|uniref:Adenylosuccinate synthetase n=1 Tax=Ruminococcus flavefaciens TaxID=1265 RepID=A0A1M7JN10_RUMFL|nr:MULTISPECIES: adenylosuccinate synthetase [Ruminococcus]MCR4795801.1 adenylosuccinate synthetase [Ruminococcus sp.]SHM54412.1 adenylosuccinate synthase [Ruminococcus flavefaciens]
MKKAYAVIGANFGDEGKGLMTDLFCRTDGSVINIRSNGGAQAGHTVCTIDGKRHIFSHIGSGCFAGADTYLSEYFILNPMLFSKELSVLGSNTGNIFIDRRCKVTLPCDMLLNQFAETIRGSERHGSCGVGVFETIVRSRDSRYSFNYDYVLKANRDALRDLINKINSEYCRQRGKELGIKGDAEKELQDILSNDILTENYLDDLYAMAAICRDADEQIIEEYDTAVFEGAQGLLLDRNREDYFPHLTPSDTGMKNIRAVLDRLEKRDTEICYVTRSFFTRHGAGRFDTESKAIAEEYGLYDKTNAPNEYQGVFRYGWFDLPEFMNSLALDKRYIANDERISIAVTHLDMTEGMVVCPTGKLLPEDIAYMAVADVLYKVSGETAADVVCQPVAEKAMARL